MINQLLPGPDRLLPLQPPPSLGQADAAGWLKGYRRGFRFQLSTVKQCDLGPHGAVAEVRGVSQREGPGPALGRANQSPQALPAQPVTTSSIPQSFPESRLS